MKKLILLTLFISTISYGQNDTIKKRKSFIKHLEELNERQDTVERKKHTVSNKFKETLDTCYTLFDSVKKAKLAVCVKMRKGGREYGIRCSPICKYFYKAVGVSIVRVVRVRVYKDNVLVEKCFYKYERDYYFPIYPDFDIQHFPDIDWRENSTLKKYGDTSTCLRFRCVKYNADGSKEKLVKKPLHSKLDHYTYSKNAKRVKEIIPESEAYMRNRKWKYINNFY